MRFCEFIKGTGRNVNVNNWFTSIDLLEMLYKICKLIFIGKIRKIERELPDELTQPIAQTVKSSMISYRMLYQKNVFASIKFSLSQAPLHNGITIDHGSNY